MSGADGDIDLRALITKIDRDRAETQKLLAGTQKLLAERGKLGSEGRKFDRDRNVQTLLAVTGLVGGVITVVKLIWPGRLP